MKAIYLIAIGLGAIAVLGVGAVASYKFLLKSGTASRLGIDNTPTDPVVIERLQWLAQQVGPVLGLVQILCPGAKLTSGYRSPALNEAVGGVTNPPSYHTRGLAYDIGGIGSHGDIEAVARFLRDNLSSLEVTPKRVLAEYDHLHLTYYDRTSGPTSFLTQIGSNPMKFTTLS